MKKVILTTILITLALFVSGSSAHAAKTSATDRVQLTIPELVEIDTGALSDLETQIPLGKRGNLPTRINLRSNSDWFVKTSTLSSLASQMQNAAASGGGNKDENSQAADLVLTQQGSWSDKSGETLVVYSISPGL
jgi:hypothetical protein